VTSVSFRALAISVVLLGLGWSLLPADPPVPEDRDKQAQAAIVDLSQNLGARDASERAKKIVQEFKSDEISSIFARKEGGGLGIGNLTDIVPQNSIERLIVTLSHRKTTTEAELDKYQADYVKVAKVMQAMAELAPYRANERIKKNDKLLQQWLTTAADFKKKTADFRQAVEERDPKKVRLSANQLHHTCCDCHSQVD